jgi:hypothetical protein
MSFNTPFTTLGYYCWLFENDNPNNSDSTLVSTSSQPTGISMGGNSSTISTEIGYYPSTNMQLSNGTHAANSSLEISTTFTSKSGSLNSIFRPNDQAGDGLENLSYSHNQYFPTHTIGKDAAPGSAASQFHNDSYGMAGHSEYTPSSSTISEHSNSSNFLNSAVTSASLGSHDWSSSVKSPASQISSPPGQRLMLRNGQPLPDAYIAQPGLKRPVISSAARDRLMREIAQSRPTRPDGLEISSSDPLLSLSSLQHYSDLFFTRFNTSYPLIHQATFDSDNVHNFLLMSILLLGATYSDTEAHSLAVCIHDVMRPLIHSSKEFSIRPKLWMLQTILLVECFGKSRAGEKQHDMRLVLSIWDMHGRVPLLSVKC